MGFGVITVRTLLLGLQTGPVSFKSLGALNEALRLQGFGAVGSYGFGLEFASAVKALGVWERSGLQFRKLAALEDYSLLGRAVPDHDPPFQTLHPRSHTTIEWTKALQHEQKKQHRCRQALEGFDLRSDDRRLCRSVVVNLWLSALRLGASGSQLQSSRFLGSGPLSLGA